MADEKKTLKFQMMMSPAEADVLDDWMFKNRVRSRAEAIRRLCQIGLRLDRDVVDMLANEISTYEEVSFLHSLGLRGLKAAEEDAAKADEIQAILKAIVGKTAEMLDGSGSDVFYSLLIEMAAITRTKNIDEALKSADDARARFHSGNTVSKKLKEIRVKKKD